MEVILEKDLRLVICDIDSTLITSDYILTVRAKRVIENLRKHGVYFGIASGRPLDEIEKRAGTWGFDTNFDILIGMNGSELWDGIHQKQFDYYKLKREWIKDTINVMRPFKNNCYIYHHGYILCRENDEMMRKSAKSSNKEIVLYKDVSEMYEEENAKIMFRVDEDNMEQIEVYLEQHQNEFYKGFKTQTTLMEFADRRISKAYALKKFCEMNMFPLKSVVAFGDTTNDNDMLACSGLGVCMCNGSDDTKAIADIITEKSNDEDGFADFMETHFPQVTK